MNKWGLVAKHKTKNVTLYRQGGVNFILNEEIDSQAENFTNVHDPSCNAIAFRVADAAKAFQSVVEQGAKPVEVGTGPLGVKDSCN